MVAAFGNACTASPYWEKSAARRLVRLIKKERWKFSPARERRKRA